MKLFSSIVSGLAGVVTVKIIQAVVRNRKSLAQKAGLNGKVGQHEQASKSGKWMTIGLYLAGAVVSAALARWLENRDQQSTVSPFNPPIESYKPVIDITV